MDVKIKTPSIFTYGPPTAAEPPWSIERSCDALLASFGFRRTVSRRWGAEPPGYYIKRWFVYNIILIVREIVLIVREIVDLRCHLQRL